MSRNVHTGKNVKLRKPRRCEWCSEWIGKGDDAYQGKGIFDGDFYDYRLHPECAEAMQEDPYVASDGFMPWDNERPVVEPSNKLSPKISTEGIEVCAS